MAGALDGLVVIDLTSHLSGPYAAMMLAGPRRGCGPRQPLKTLRPAGPGQKRAAERRGEQVGYLGAGTTPALGGALSNYCAGLKGIVGLPLEKWGYYR
jgi:hypothetical protein